MKLALRPEAPAGAPAGAGLEWLVANGLGGWASGTLGGANTRRYHGLLVPALRPPLGRTVLVAQINLAVSAPGQPPQRLAQHDRVEAGALDPEVGKANFELNRGVPVWHHNLAGAQLAQRIWLHPGSNTTYVTYDLAPGAPPLTLTAQIMVAGRDAHAETRRGDGAEPVVAAGEGSPPRVGVLAGGAHFWLAASRGEFVPEQVWHLGVLHPAEAERGLPAIEDYFAAGTYRVRLEPGQDWALTFSLDAAADPHTWRQSLAHTQARAERLVAQAGLQGEPAWVQQLVLAADQFIVRRGQGHTVIAGYHWFSDWGRDTMIALPGLALATRRFSEAASILRTFARYASQGMLPNRFPDEGHTPEFNTVDATLWYFHAVDRYLEATGDEALARDLWPVLADIVAWHGRGTRYGIRRDPADGLLWAGDAGGTTQLTWMDVRIGDRPVTPRTGKPVEINALWVNALRVMARLAARLRVAQPLPYLDWAQTAADSFDRFWYSPGGYLFDVIDGPGGPDASLRPNQLIAVGLPHGPFSAGAGDLGHAQPLARARAAVDACARHLLTPVGLRTLSPADPAYRARFAGGPVERDSAYHQGTVWPWLIGPYVDAHLRAFGDPAAARRLLAAFERLLTAAGMGTLPEVCEPEPPHAPGGCIAQAWSVAEVLRAWLVTRGGG